jgi:hypothetical protein
MISECGIFTVDFSAARHDCVQMVKKNAEAIKPESTLFAVVVGLCLMMMVLVVGDVAPDAIV